MDALQRIVDKIDPSSSDSIFAFRNFLTNLLPLGPLLEWETEYGGVNRSTPEEVVGWMEGIVYFFPLWIFFKFKCHRTMS